MRVGPHFALLLSLAKCTDAFSTIRALRLTTRRPTCQIVCEQQEETEKRLIPKTDDPRLFWFDELFDTPSERAERDRLKQANIAKWGSVLRGADTFDDDKQSKPAATEIKRVAGIPADWLLVGGSAVVLLACASAAFASDVAAAVF